MLISGNGIWSFATFFVISHSKSYFITNNLNHHEYEKNITLFIHRTIGDAVHTILCC